MLKIFFLENLENHNRAASRGFRAGELWVGCWSYYRNLLAGWLQSDDNRLSEESDIVISWGGACTARCAAGCGLLLLLGLIAAGCAAVE